MAPKVYLTKAGRVHSHVSKDCVKLPRTLLLAYALHSLLTPTSICSAVGITGKQKVSAVVFRESKDEGSQSQAKANTRDSAVEAATQGEETRLNSEGYPGASLSQRHPGKPSRAPPN